MAQLTIATAEAVLVQRLGPAMVASDLSKSPAADPSPRAYLGDAIAVALAILNLKVEDPSAPTDAEVRVLSRTQWRPFHDVAEWRLLETLAGNFAYVTYKKTSGDGQDLSDLRKDYQAMADRKLAQVKLMYPWIKWGVIVGVPLLAPGVPFPPSALPYRARLAPLVYSRDAEGAEVGTPGTPTASIPCDVQWCDPAGRAVARDDASGVPWGAARANLIFRPPLPAPLRADDQVLVDSGPLGAYAAPEVWTAEGSPWDRGSGLAAVTCSRRA